MSDPMLEDAQTVGRRVLVTLPVVRELSWRRQLAMLFEDMHLVWAGMGASAATLVCVAAALGLMRLTLREQPASMKAMIVAMADPGSNRNPLAPDGRLLMPTASLAGMVDPPMLDREDALVAFAAVVTREGTVRNLELLLQDAGSRAGGRPRDWRVARRGVADAFRAGAGAWRRAGRREHGVARGADARARQDGHARAHAAGRAVGRCRSAGRVPVALQGSPSSRRRSRPDASARA